MSDIHALSRAILRAAGIADPDNAIGVRFEQQVGDLPRLWVERVAWNVDTSELDRFADEYEITMKAKPTEEQQ